MISILEKVINHRISGFMFSSDRISDRCRFPDHFRTLLDISRHSRTILIFSKQFRTFQNISEHFRTFQNISEHFQTFQNISKHFKTFQNISEHFRIVRNIFRTLQNISEHFSILCCILHISNLYIFQLRFAAVMELVQPSLLGRIIGRQKLYFITSRAGSDVDMCSKTFQNILKHFKSIVFP